MIQQSIPRSQHGNAMSDKKTELKKNVAAKANTITLVDTDPFSFLYLSDSEDSSVNTVRVEDRGSRPRKSQ